MRIGIVAGEASGDYLGAGLLRALKTIVSDLHVEGIAGPQMIKEGARSMFPMEDISLIGVDGLVKNFARLLSIRRHLYQHFSSHPPDLFIGIDLPDFNLQLERRLKKVGISTIQYVSPTVWAWRTWRIRKIRKSVDHMLVLFPFEEEFCKKNGIAATFVGHPSADDLSDISMEDLRRKLGLPYDRELVALLPGSRKSEVISLGEDFLEAASLLHLQRPGIEFAVPYVSQEIQEIFRSQKKRIAQRIVLHEFHGHSLQVMGASNVILAASGTAALEGAMLRKPVIVAYKISQLSYLLAKQMMKTPYVSMPNNLLDEHVIPEILQNDVTALRLSTEVTAILENPQRSKEMVERLEIIYRMLKNNANQLAAKKVVELAATWAAR